MEKRQRSPVTGNPDDLEDWEPVVRHLADALFTIREQGNLMVQRPKTIDEKIGTLRQNLVGKECSLDLCVSYALYGLDACVGC